MEKNAEDYFPRDQPYGCLKRYATVVTLNPSGATDPYEVDVARLRSCHSVGMLKSVKIGDVIYNEVVVLADNHGVKNARATSIINSSQFEFFADVGVKYEKRIRKNFDGNAVFVLNSRVEDQIALSDDLTSVMEKFRICFEDYMTRSGYERTSHALYFRINDVLVVATDTEIDVQLADYEDRKPDWFSVIFGSDGVIAVTENAISPDEEFLALVWFTAAIQELERCAIEGRHLWARGQ